MDTQLIKAVAKFAVSVGTTVIVSGIISNNVNAKTVKTKILVVAAGFVIASMLDEKTGDYVDRQIDAAAGFYEKHVLPRFQK